MTSKALALKTPDQAVIEYRGESITVTKGDIIRYICPLADEGEVGLFLKVCQTLQLNPFAREIYLIKYSDRDKASIVIAIDSYLKAAESNDQYDGHEAGIILREPSGKLEWREGAFIAEEEKENLAGGWAKVYRKDRARPFFVAVNKNECIRYNRDGRLTQFWSEEKQPHMLRKVALKRSLVETFPSLFNRIVAANVEVLDAEPAEELPRAFEKDGKEEWDKFFGRAKDELGLDAKAIHETLDKPSLKQWMEDEGKTLEDVWQLLAAKVKEKVTSTEEKLAEREREPVKAAMTRRRGKQEKEDDKEWHDMGKPPGKEEPPAEESKPTAPTPAEIPRIAPQDKPKEAVPLPAKKPRDLKTITDINSLYKACHEDFGLQPGQVLKELGYRTQMDFQEKPSDAYLKIKAVYGAERKSQS